MPDTSARLGLPFLLPSQAQKHVTHNEALERLDVLTQLVLEERDATTPPLEPANGAIYALGPAPEEAWSGNAGLLAYWVAPNWQFFTSVEGWQAWDESAQALCHYSTGAWRDTAPAHSKMTAPVVFLRFSTFPPSPTSRVPS